MSTIKTVPQRIYKPLIIPSLAVESFICSSVVASISSVPLVVILEFGVICVFEPLSKYDGKQ